MSVAGCRWQPTTFCGETTCVMTLRLLLYLIHLYIFNCCVLYTIPEFFPRAFPSRFPSVCKVRETAYQNLGAITITAHSKFQSVYCPSGPITLCWQSWKKQADPRSWKSSLSQQGVAVCAVAVNGQLVMPQRGWDHWGDEHRAVICHWRCALCSVKGSCCLSTVGKSSY